MKRLPLILAVLAAPAYAENAPPEPPKTQPAPTVTFGSGNPTAPYKAQHWTGVCEYLPDGRLLVHTAFLRNPQIAAEQCREWLEEKQ